MIGSALRAVERFLLPNSCVVCGTMVGTAAPDSLVCAPCRSRLRPVPLGCDRCSQPIPPVGPCRFCADWPDGLTDATSAVWLGEEAREIVHHLKYGGYTNLATFAARTIAAHTKAPSHPATIIPVPLGLRRRIERGYNQAAEIARALGGIWSLSVEENVIRRRRETRSQTSLTPDERVQNVRGVFRAVLPARQTIPKNGKASSDTVESGSGVAILIDDVLTTGATLASAATALLDAGWGEVRAVTFARALPFVVRLDTPV